MNENATGGVRKLYEFGMQVDDTVYQHRAIVGYRAHRFDVQVSIYDGTKEKPVEDSPINRIMGRKSRSEGDPVHKTAKATVLVYCPSSGWHEVLSSINKDFVTPDQIDALTVDLLELAMSVMS